jgi:hypothetical protein
MRPLFISVRARIEFPSRLISEWGSRGQRRARPAGGAASRQPREQGSGRSGAFSPDAPRPLRTESPKPREVQFLSPRSKLRRTPDGVLLSFYLGKMDTTLGILVQGVKRVKAINL